jgi:hypothetical protein
MNDYQPSAPVKTRNDSKQEPIPVVFIPRKPHPNGLLVYLLASFINHPVRPDSKVPFILDILPHLKVGDAAPVDAFCKFIDRFEMK